MRCPAQINWSSSGLDLRKAAMCEQVRYSVFKNALELMSLLGARDAKIASIPSRDRLPAQSKWEMSI